MDFILEHDLDILSITETWLKSDDSFSVSNVTPPGFSILSCPRLCKHVGGVAVVIKNSLKIIEPSIASFSTLKFTLFV